MALLTSKSVGWRRSSSLIVLALWLASFTFASAQPAPVDEVIARASAYVAEFERTFASLVAEEVYDQGRKHRLRSSFMLVLVPGRGFTPFRDTFEVNGKPVHDRDDRLLSLFLNPSASSLEQARRITEESTRYNGAVERTINVPLFAMLFLHPDNVTHFTFSNAGEATIAGRRVRAINYHEVTLPAIVKGTGGKDLPSKGRIWIEPATGAVLQTRHQVDDDGGLGTITVRFAEDRKLGILVPAKMDEVYQGLRFPAVIRATATYDRYQRVGVSTDTEIAKPPVKPPG